MESLEERRITIGNRWRIEGKHIRCLKGSITLVINVSWSKLVSIFSLEMKHPYSGCPAMTSQSVEPPMVVWKACL